MRAQNFSNNEQLTLILTHRIATTSKINIIAYRISEYNTKKQACRLSAQNDLHKSSSHSIFHIKDIILQQKKKSEFVSTRELTYLDSSQSCSVPGNVMEPAY